MDLIAEPNGVGNLIEITSEGFISLMDLNGRDRDRQLHIDNELPDGSTYIVVPRYVPSF